MTDDTPWSSAETIAHLSREPVGAELAEQVASKLIKDRGRRGVWYTHRDYCGHGLIFLHERICLVEYSDGFPQEGSVLKSWQSESDFAQWLGAQSDYSLSSADPEQKELFTTDPWRLNNQRITTRRLERYVAGERNP